MSGRTIDAIVLAAERAGGPGELALSHGVSHKCLVPIAGRPLIDHVVTALSDHPGVATITVVIEHEAFSTLAEATWNRVCPAHLRVVAAADNIADSVIAAGRDLQGPILITTADNVLLNSQAIDAVMAAIADADAAIALAPREAVLAAHPDGQRRFYRFRDGEFSNCNLYALSDPQSLKAAETFRGGGQFARKAGRMIRAFGLLNVVLMACGLLSLGGAMRRVSRRIRLRLVPVVLADGAQAIDVDNARTYAIAEVLRARRERATNAVRLQSVA